MLLLIQYSIPKILAFIHIYIPLCFYLYVYRCRLTNHVPSFTFHYASTYTRCRNCLTISTSNIYIPLCFYLYFNRPRDSSIPVYIYIPLCFYLYVFPTPTRKSGREIYIPLCFYLYPAAPEPAAPEPDLHSTMLLLIQNDGIYIIPANKIFTFHYASTYTTESTAIR